MINYFSLTKSVDNKQFMKFAKGILDTYGKPGHYYSPLETISVIEAKRDKITNKTKPLKDINLNIDGQLEILTNFKQYNHLVPFQNDKYDCLYQPQNNYYPITDATILFSMIMQLKPRHIIEVGSGHSSALMIDTNRIYFNSSINIQCIEPYPDRLYSLLTEQNKSEIEVYDTFIQDIDLSIFNQLEANDILFIDSSHVSKVLSDVNFFIFDVFPILNKNVFIHFHDIYYPFEYPLRWYRQGRFYNEAYILRAFLQNNNNYKINFWTNFMTNKYHKQVKEIFPSIHENTGGSIWISKSK